MLMARNLRLVIILPLLAQIMIKFKSVITKQVVQVILGIIGMAGLMKLESVIPLVRPVGLPRHITPLMTIPLFSVLKVMRKKSGNPF
jgi:hypothetical protein